MVWRGVSCPVPDPLPVKVLDGGKVKAQTAKVIYYFLLICYMWGWQRGGPSRVSMVTLVIVQKCQKQAYENQNWTTGQNVAESDKLHFLLHYRSLLVCLFPFFGTDRRRQASCGIMSDMATASISNIQFKC